MEWVQQHLIAALVVASATVGAEGAGSAFPGPIRRKSRSSWSVTGSTLGPVTILRPYISAPPSSVATPWTHLDPAESETGTPLG